MSSRIALYPIPSVAFALDDQPFDPSFLPAPIVPDVTVENVSSLLADSFDWLEIEMGRHNLEAMRAVHYAIVHRYDPGIMDIGGEADHNAESLVRNLSACLRVIRPMRQRASFIRGTISHGKFSVDHFENPIEPMDVPSVQKVFALRTVDLKRLQKNAAAFLDAMTKEFWKFRMAVQFHDAGHFSHVYWKARFSLWCSALEALFTSNTAGNKGSLVAKERIKWFLGPKTSIYGLGDIPKFERTPHFTIEDVVDDLYTLRNLVAHGDKVPDRFFKEARTSFGVSVTLAEVLLEAISFIIRASLLRVLEDRLLAHFANGVASDAYFRAYGLDLASLRRKSATP